MTNNITPFSFTPFGISPQVISSPCSAISPCTQWETPSGTNTNIPAVSLTLTTTAKFFMTSNQKEYFFMSDSKMYALDTTTAIWDIPLNLTGGTNNPPSLLTGQYISFSLGTKGYSFNQANGTTYVFDSIATTPGWISPIPSASQTPAANLNFIPFTLGSKQYFLGNDEQVYIFNGTTWENPIIPTSNPPASTNSIPFTLGSKQYFLDNGVIYIFNGTTWENPIIPTSNPPAPPSSTPFTLSSKQYFLDNNRIIYIFNGTTWENTIATDSGHTPTSSTTIAKTFALGSIQYFFGSDQTTYVFDTRSLTWNTPIASTGNTPTTTNVFFVLGLKDTGHFFGNNQIEYSLTPKVCKNGMCTPVTKEFALFDASTWDRSALELTVFILGGLFIVLLIALILVCIF